MADAFAAHGYRVQCNSVRTGSSGARHEVDVWAERDDGLVTSAVAVECKNLTHPVDAQVVGRLRMVRDDLRATHAVLVAPGGHTPAAEAAARDARMSLWTREVLAQHLGHAAMEEVRRPLHGAQMEGFARRVASREALRALRVHVTGSWGLRRERLIEAWRAWLPLHELELAVTADTGRGPARARTVVVTCDAVAGELWSTADAAADGAAVERDAPVIDARVTAAALEEAITQAAVRRDQVSQPAARARHMATLDAYGIDPAARQVTVARRRTLYLPVWLGVAERRQGHRVVVLDGVCGRIDPELGDRLTPYAGALMESLSTDGAPTATAAP